MLDCINKRRPSPAQFKAAAGAVDMGSEPVPLLQFTQLLIDDFAVLVQQSRLPRFANASALGRPPSERQSTAA